MHNGCLLSPKLLISLPTCSPLSYKQPAWQPCRRSSDKLSYADNTHLIAEPLQDLQFRANTAPSSTTLFGRVINTSKMKAKRCSLQPDSLVNPTLQLGGGIIEWMENFTYLGSLLLITTSETSRDAWHLQTPVLKPWCPSGGITIYQTRLFDSLIIPIAIYACESWTLKNYDQRRIATF